MYSTSLAIQTPSLSELYAQYFAEIFVLEILVKSVVDIMVQP